MDAALEAIAETGVAALSLRDLARRLGVSHAAPKNHFADKRALYTALATEAHERLAAAMAQELDRTRGDAIARLTATGRAYLAFARREPASFAVMGEEALQDRADAELSRASGATFSMLVGPASELAAEGDHDPVQLALLAWTLAHGLADLQASGALADLPGGDDPAALDESMLTRVESVFRRAFVG